MSVTNLSDKTAEINAAISDVQIVSTSGVITLNVPDATNPQGLGSSMTLVGQDTFTLAPGERRDLQYHIQIPAGSPGGSRFGAVSFSSGPPPEAGKVRIISEVASLMVVRVRGVVLELPTSTTLLTLSLPVKAPEGVKIADLHDPVSKVQVSPEVDSTKITMPLRDHQGVEQGTMIAVSKAGLVGTGTGSAAKVESLRVNGNVWQSHVGTESATALDAQVQLSFTLKSVPSKGEIDLLVSAKPDQQMEAAINMLASQAGATVKDVAYVVQVDKKNVQDVLHITNARITLSVSRKWAEENNPALVRIVRYGDDGAAQLLNTVFKGYQGDFAVFECTSPNGLSLLGLLALDQAAAATETAVGALPPPVISVPAQGTGVFNLLLSPQASVSSEATATDDQGQPVGEVVVGNVTMSTEVLAPPASDVKIRSVQAVQSGGLHWLKVPRVALAGHNTITLRFQNTGTGDYVVQTGLVRVVKMSGKWAGDLLVPNFNAFPNGDRDIALDWVTSSSAFGRYTLAAETTFGEPPQMVLSDYVKVWVVPWKWLLSLMLVSGGLLGGVWMLLRSMRGYIERQVERRIRDVQASVGTGLQGSTSTLRRDRGSYDA